MFLKLLIKWSNILRNLERNSFLKELFRQINMVADDERGIVYEGHKDGFKEEPDIFLAEVEVAIKKLKK